jgi:hypothetical protein
MSRDRPEGAPPCVRRQQSATYRRLQRPRNGGFGNEIQSAFDLTMPETPSDPLDSLGETSTSVAISLHGVGPACGRLGDVRVHEVGGRAAVAEYAPGFACGVAGPSRSSAFWTVSARFAARTGNLCCIAALAVQSPASARGVALAQAARRDRLLNNSCLPQCARQRNMQ